jgi:hypothetical protein
MKNENIRIKWKEFIEHDKYKQYFLSNEQKWKNNLDNVILYIDNNNKRPSSENKNINIKYLGRWLEHQQKNYVQKKEIMKNNEIYTIWINFINNNKYKKYFMTNEEDWLHKLEEVKKYIDINNKKPSCYDKDFNIKQLSKWIDMQQYNYSKKQKIMKNINIYNLWENFINQSNYKIYFVSNKHLLEDIWKQNLEKIKLYIDNNNKKPSLHDKIVDIRQLGTWLSSQQKNYKKKINNMKNDNIRNLWEDFIKNEKYTQYFQSNEEEWENKLKEVKKYIDINNKKPSCHDKNIEIKQLGNWIANQQKNYTIRKYIMKKKDIRNRWENFINEQKYNKYFITNEEEWENKLKIIKIFIDDNNKRPSSEDKNSEIKQLGKWLSTQQQSYSKNRYIMRENNIKQQWENFINSDKYKKYF